MKKILLTGGHAASTAYAVFNELKKRDVKNKIYWIGSKYAVEGKKYHTLEYELFSKADVQSFSLDSGRLQRRFTFWTIPSLFKIPKSVMQALYLMFKINPDILVSFGGHTAVPVVIAAWAMHIPIIVHEQTAAAGRANLFAEKFAKIIALSRETSVKYFKSSKRTVLVGNPISKEVSRVKPKNTYKAPGKILITGGSRGSQKINSCIEDILGNLLESYEIVHQTGLAEKDKFIKLRENLPAALKEKYSVYGSIHPDIWHEFLEWSDVVISRAGGNVCAQLGAVKRPCILVPIGFSYLNEQMKNAKLLEDIGICKILTEDNLNPKSLGADISDMFENYEKITQKSKNYISPDIKASEKLVNLILQNV